MPRQVKITLILWSLAASLTAFVVISNEAGAPVQEAASHAVQAPS